MKKKCEGCILNRPNTNDIFKCEGDLNYTDCVAHLQGAIEMLDRKPFEIFDAASPAVRRVDYEIYGSGSFYITKDATEEAIALAILDDCPDTEIHYEYYDD